MDALLPPSPTFLAVSWSPVVGPPAGLANARVLMGVPDARAAVADDGLLVVFNGTVPANQPVDSAGPMTWMLSRDVRVGGRDATPADVAQWLSSPSLSAAVSLVLPPFAAAHRSGRNRPLVVAGDALGFRHLYVHRGDRWAAVSSSARVLAVCASTGIDHEAVAAQSLLGWQVGSNSFFAEVRKLGPGESVSLNGGRLTIEPAVSRPFRRPADLDAAAHVAADLVRSFVNDYLDDHPDVVLQLTGGQDSRILLAAVPPARRRGLTAMTLAVPGSPDHLIAARLAHQNGMRHDVVGMQAVGDRSPADAYALTRAASRRLDATADPLAFAALAVAESTLDQVPRLSGLGGEVVRGFYYLGPPRRVPVTRRRVERLAAWRLFPNERVGSRALEAGFAQWGHDATVDRLECILRSSGPDWLSATDAFYLGQRMHRWAGVLATATCFDRSVVNPMLDHGFLALGRSLPPPWKANSRFLSSILCELDPELAAIPMDGRPAPNVYAHPGISSTAKLTVMTARKAAGKARQRLRSVSRPPAGGEVLANLVVEHWTAHPELLDGVRALGIVDSDWLEDVLTGRSQAGASAVALLVNLEQACSLDD